MRNCFLSSRAITVFMFGIFFMAASARSMDCSMRDLSASDTFDLYMADKPVGTLVHALEYDENASVMLVSTTMSVSMGGAAGNNLDVQEQRRFNAGGAMISAYQEVAGPSGVNSWAVKKDVDQWDYIVIVGGVRTTRKAGDISDNLSSSCKLFHGIKTAAVHTGDMWYDTAFEMVSAQNIITKIRCVDVDSALHVWRFENTDNLTNRTEKQTVDANARVVEETIAGIYTAKNRDKRFAAMFSSNENHASQKQPSENSMDLSELFSIPASRPKFPEEHITLSGTDSPITLDSTVSRWYSRKGDLWVLGDVPRNCVSKTAHVPEKMFSPWLQPTISMQSDNPKIVALSRSLQEGQKDACALIDAFTRYVYTTLKKRNTATFSNALETLNAGFGDCGEHAVLLGALLRAAGVPARIVLGLVYVGPKKAYMYHAWVLAHADDWVFADAALGAFPATENYVPLIIDDTGANAIKVSRLIGKIAVNYLNNTRK